MPVQDETGARRAESSVDPYGVSPYGVGPANTGGGVEPGRDRRTIGLSIVALALAGALGLVLFLPGTESAAPTTTAGPTTPPSTVTTPSTTIAPTTQPTTSTATLLEPFVMPAEISGQWASPDGSATATFSPNALTQLDALIDGGDLGQIRILLAWPSAIGPMPSATSPSSAVVEAIVEINGVRRPARSVAVLAPDAQGLSLSIPLTIEPSLFDLAEPEVEFIAVVDIRPAG